MTAKKSKLPFFLIALVIAAFLVWFLMFRPVTPDEKLVQDDGETKVYDPVSYDVDSWASTPKQPLDFEQLKTQLGTTATSESALDYYGNHATKYRFVNKTEPPFYVIESDSVLEAAWYYAAPKDDDRQKQASINYAKKAYAMMGAYAGTDGENLIKSILANPNKAYDKALDGIITADCMDYQCRIVFNK